MCIDACLLACLLACLDHPTYHKFQMSIFKYFTKIDVKHVRPVEGYCQVQYWGPEAKKTEVEARVALICASTDNGRSLTGGG